MAAFEAEMMGLEAEEGPKTSVAGPRAPKVIAAAPMRSAPPSTSALPTLGGPHVPGSEWQLPGQMATVSQGAAPAIATPDPVMSQTPSSSRPADAAMSQALQPPSQQSSSSSNYVCLGVQPTAPSRAPAPLPPAITMPPPPSRGGSELAQAGGKASAPPTATKRYCAGVQWEDKTLLEWPEDDFRIFVGDLGNESNDDVLAHAFQRYPSFQRAKVVRNKSSGKSLGYGFVSFKDPWDMTKALREMHGKYIGNRPVKVRKSTWKERGADHKKDVELHHSLAISDKAMRKGLEGANGVKSAGAIRKEKRYGKKPKNGMPW